MQITQEYFAKNFLHKIFLQILLFINGFLRKNDTFLGSRESEIFSDSDSPGSRLHVPISGKNYRII